MAIDTGNSQLPEEIDTSADSMDDAAEKKKRKPRISFEERLPEFRNLAKAGKSQEEICNEMGLDQNAFFKLYFLICQQDGIQYKIEAKSPMRKCKVKNGEFKVSRTRLVSLGLEEVFAEDKVLKFRKDGKSLVVEVVD